MKKVAALLAVLFCVCGCSADHREERTVFTMDSFFTLTDYGGNDRAVTDKVFKLAQELEKKLSVTDPQSEICAANHANGARTELSAETAELLKKTLELSAFTDGALDPTLYPVTAEWGFTTGEYKIPGDGRVSELLELTGRGKVEADGSGVTLPAGMMLDFGATAKGYALDKAAELLKSAGASSVVMNFGGNIRTVGLKPDGSPWLAAVADPEAPSENLCIFELGEGAIATSGSYQRYFTGDDGARYCHIIDPASGRPVQNGLASVSVVSGEALLCDALSTALFVMGGERAADFWRENGGFEMVIVEESGRIRYTEGLSGSFRLAEGREGTPAEVIAK